MNYGIRYYDSEPYEYSPEYEHLKGRMGSLGDYADMARIYANTIQGAGRGGPGSWGEPLFRSAVIENITNPQGMGPAGYAAAKGNVIGQFRSLTRQAGSRSADSGDYNPGSVDTAVGGAPSTALATGLSGVDVANEQMKQEQRQKGIEALGGQMPELMRRSDAYTDSLGGMIGEFARSTGYRRTRNPSWNGGML